MEKRPENEQKEERRAFSHEMASMMHTCLESVGPKSENVKKPLVFKCFFEGSKEQKVFQEDERPSEKEWFLVKELPKKQSKNGKSAFSHDMASMVHICSDLVGPKSENVKKNHWFLNVF